MGSSPIHGLVVWALKADGNAEPKARRGFAVPMRASNSLGSMAIDFMKHNV
jgi:hypothetical protein